MRNSEIYFRDKIKKNEREAMNTKNEAMEATSPSRQALAVARQCVFILQADGIAMRVPDKLLNFSIHNCARAIEKTILLLPEIKISGSCPFCNQECAGGTLELRDHIISKHYENGWRLIAKASAQEKP